MKLSRLNFCKSTLQTSGLSSVINEYMDDSQLLTGVPTWECRDSVKKLKTMTKLWSVLVSFFNRTIELQRRDIWVGIISE